MRRWFRRFLGIDLIREDLLDLTHRANKLQESLDELRNPVIDAHFRLRHIQSFFGDTPDDSPLTKQDLETRNPWDRA